MSLISFGADPCADNEPEAELLEQEDDQQRGDDRPCQLHVDGVIVGVVIGVHPFTAALIDVLNALPAAVTSDDVFLWTTSVVASATYTSAIATSPMLDPPMSIPTVCRLRERGSAGRSQGHRRPWSAGHRTPERS